MKTNETESTSVKWKAYWLLLKIGLIAYLGIYLVSELTLGYLIPIETIVTPPVEGESAWWFTISFLLISAPIIYFGNSLLGGGLLKIKINRLFLYIGLTMFLGNVVELFLNQLFILFIDRPSWLYHIWPKYHGYSSVVTAIMWPLYGFHILCFQMAMKKRNSLLVSSVTIRGIMVGIDAMVMELIANLFALIGFKSYFFYYLANDLNHFTTLEIFIPYVIVGLIIMSLFKYLDKPKFPRLIIGIICLLVGWGILYFMH